MTAWNLTPGSKKYSSRNGRVGPLLTSVLKH